MRSSTEAAIGSDTFRKVLGHFVTGVTVVTALDGDRPFGITMPLLYYRRRYLRVERAATSEVEGKPEA
jgi:hypothetical protein